MSDIIRWCNGNQGFLSGCLTFVYVIATLWLVGLGRRQLAQAIELERSRTRPVVIFDVFREHHSFFAQILNSGQTAARDVKINVVPHLQYVFGGEDSIPRDERTKPIPFIERGIPMLAAGREIKALIGFSKRVHSAYSDMRLEGSVSYKDVKGTSYSEPFAIDLAAIEALAYRVSKDIEDVAEQLEEIAQTLGRVATGFSKPLVRVISEKEHVRQAEAFIEEVRSGSGEQSTLQPPDEQISSQEPTP